MPVGAPCRNWGKGCTCEDCTFPGKPPYWDSTNQTERTGMNLDATKRLYDLGRETGKRGYRWCYVAGPMRSKPGQNYEAFNEAARTLRDYGWHVFNPAETDAEVRDAAEKAPNPLSVYMQQDLVDVCKSDVVFVLEDWEDSEGADLEVEVAKRLGIRVYAFPEIVDILEDPIATEADFAAAGFPSAPVLDHVTPAGDPVTKRFDHEKGHLVDLAGPLLAAQDARATVKWNQTARAIEETLFKPEELGVPGQVWPVPESSSAPTYEIKGDSVTLPSGLNRASEDGKIDYLLVRDGPMFKRWAELMTRAVPKRGRRNWMKANTPDDLERFQRGFSRHAEQWLAGEADEDHAAACIFNLNGAEYVRELHLDETMPVGPKGVDTVTHSG